LDDRSLRKIARQIDAKYLRDLAFELGFTEAELSIIVSDNVSTKDQIHKVLVRWKVKQLSHVNQREALSELLRNIELVNLADTVMNGE
jgi:hypothetical protein